MKVSRTLGMFGIGATLGGVPAVMLGAGPIALVFGLACIGLAAAAAIFETLR